MFAKENTYPFVYARAKDKDVVLVILNPSGKEATAEFELNTEYTKTLVLAGKELSLNKTGKKISLKYPDKPIRLLSWNNLKQALKISTMNFKKDASELLKIFRTVLGTVWSI